MGKTNHITLDADQERALEKFKEGRNLAIFGGAGCGKSVLLNAILAYARKEIGVFPILSSCALSNHAASHIDGKTIHSLFGAPPYWPFSANLWDMIKERPFILQTLTKIKVLIIDEITLISDRVLDTLDVVLRNAVEEPGMSTVPFGGRQIVIAGDPFQLEPIIDDSQYSTIPAHSSSLLASMCIEQYNRRRPGPVQNSLAWYLTFGGFGNADIVFLKLNHRQSSDKSFFDILRRVRVGICSLEDIESLNALSRKCPTIPETHTRLCLRRDTVAKVNHDILEKIEGQLFINVAEDKMLHRNISTLRRLDSAANRVFETKAGGELLLTMDIGQCRPGTRVKVLEVLGAQLQRKIITALRVETQDETRRSFVIRRHLYCIRDHDCSVIASREQFPLVPAYAMTVHRCQGMTLSRIAVAFEQQERWRPFGLVYVALSRCKSMKGLWVKGLTKNMIRISPSSCSLMRKIKCLQEHFPDRVIGNATIPHEDDRTPLCSKTSNGERAASPSSIAISGTSRPSKRSKTISSS